MKIAISDIPYRQGFLEIAHGIREGHINLEAWNVAPEVLPLPASVASPHLRDEDVTANVELELSLAQARTLVALLQQAIASVEATGFGTLAPSAVNAGAIQRQTPQGKSAMRLEQVEIYSDASNAAVMRHPGRRFPGVLVQGDTICSLVSWLSRAAAEIETSSLSDEAQEGLLYVHEVLSGLAEHYSAVVSQHGIRPPRRGA